MTSINFLRGVTDIFEASKYRQKYRNNVTNGTKKISIYLKIASQNPYLLTKFGRKFSHFHDYFDHLSSKNALKNCQINF